MVPCNGRYLKQDPGVKDAETWLEHLVMGRDYDSWQVGKQTDQPSQWLWGRWLAGC